jgi:hypothetical protein
MIAPPPISRRRFVVTSSLAVAAFGIRPALSAVTTAPPLRVVFDPAIAESVRFASAARRRGSDCHALTGDPYRFVLGLLAVAEPSSHLAGVTSYADFLLLTGTLQEARYRLIGHDLQGVARQADTSVAWRMKPRNA